MRACVRAVHRGDGSVEIYTEQQKYIINTHTSYCWITELMICALCLCVRMTFSNAIVKLPFVTVMGLKIKIT